MKQVKLYKLLILFFSLFLSFFRIYYLFADENIPVPEVIIPQDSSWVLDPWMWENNTSSWEITLPQENPIPPLIISLQSPSYLIWQSETMFFCDPTKSECKANFDLRDTFGWYISTKYACLIDFSFITGEEAKCNPNTIIFPLWTSQIKFKLYEKGNPSIFQEKTIIIINEKAKIEVPNPLLTVQSGLEKKEENYYECKTEECSANFTLENSFSWSSSNYACLWNFWSGSFENAETPNLCNPSYVKFPFWKHDLSAKIYEKTDINNFKEITFFIENTFSSAPPAQSNSGSLSWSTEENSSFPILQLSLQSPSYIKETDGIYYCDTTKTECKANFDFSDTFGWYVPTKYACNIAFPFWTGEEEKCNPNTVIFPEWVFEVTFKIYEKENPINFTEKLIKISNIKVISSSSSNSIITQQQENRNIIIQSWLLQDGDWKYFCSEESCWVNLSFQKRSDESCLWNFWWGSFKEKYQYTCNPWKVHFPNWNYIISLKVNDENNASSEYFFRFQNKYFEEMRKINTPPNAKISLQGKLGKDKKQEGNSLVCYDTLECSVNFTGKESFDLERNSLDYFWNFWDGGTFSWANPVMKKYKPWKYKISLTVKDTFSENSDYFFVEVLAPWEIEAKFLDKNIFSYLKISAINANPKWVDDNEWIEIKNTSFSLLNLKGLIIEDSLLWGSKKYSIKDDFFLFPLEKKKFYKSETNINLNNDEDEVNLIYNNKIIDTLSWNFPLMDDYILSPDNLLIQSQKVKVIEVIDGDTILIEFPDGRKEKLRFIGVDTPETKHPKKKVEYFWKEASEFTKKILSWKEVFLEIDKENYRDKYGRLLGYIYLEENGKKEFFNLKLIELWYARAYLVFPFKYSVVFKNAQTLARKNLIWMWWDEEMLKEIKILEKEEKDILEKNEILELKQYTLEKFVNWFYSFSEKKEINSPEELLGPPIISIYKRWQSGKNEMQFTNFAKEEENKIQKSFRVSIAKLKSWLRFSGTTLPLAEVKIYYDDFIYKVSSDEKGKFSFKTLENIQVWNYEASFEIIEKNGNIHTITKTKTFSLTKEYVNSIQTVLVKKYEKELKKLEKKKKIKKPKKKKVKKPKIVKPKKISVQTEYKTNIWAKKWENLDLRMLNFLFLIFWTLVLYLVIDKKEEKE